MSGHKYLVYSPGYAGQPNQAHRPRITNPLTPAQCLHRFSEVCAYGVRVGVDTEALAQVRAGAIGIRGRIQSNDRGPGSSGHMRRTGVRANQDPAVADQGKQLLEAGFANEVDEACVAEPADGAAVFQFGCGLATGQDG